MDSIFTEAKYGHHFITKHLNTTVMPSPPLNKYTFNEQVRWVMMIYV